MMRSPCIALALCWTFAACSRSREPAAEHAATPPADTALLSAETVAIAGFRLVPVTRAPWREVLTAPARVALDPTGSESIGAIAEGRVMRVYRMPGDRVARGQPLVAIHAHELMDARAEFARAQSALLARAVDLRAATSALARAKRLLELKSASIADVERAEALHADALALHEAARAEQSRTDALVHHLVGDGPLPTDYDEHWVLIRSPFAGTIVGRQAEPGTVVLVGAPLLTVSRAGSLVVVAHVAEGMGDRVAPGATLTFTAPGLGDRMLAARVTRVFPTVDTVTRTVEVHATLPPRTTLVRAETFGTAQIQLGADRPTLQVPASAIQSLDGDTVVVEAETRGEGMKLSARRVRVGRLTRQWAELLAGIDSGRTVVDGGASIAKAEIVKRRGGAEGGDAH